MKYSTFESCEARRLLAYGPFGAPETAQTAAVGAVEAADSLNNGIFAKHIVAWTTGADVKVRVFASDGSPFGTSITANTTNGATRPDVGFDSNEGFVVVWQGPDADGSGIFGQYFDAGGNPIGTEFQVNTTETGAQTAPRVGIADDGTFFVVWESDTDGPGANLSTIQGQRFTIGGTPSGTEFTVSDGAVATNPDIAVSGTTGDAVAVWQSGAAIKAQRIANAGTKTGGVISVTSATTARPAVGISDGGDFVVGFTDTSGATGVVKARRYQANGTAVAGAFNVASTAVNDQAASVVDMAGDGRFAIGWAESLGGGIYNTLAFRVFKPNGQADGIDNRIDSVKFSGDQRFGLAAQETDLVRVGYAASVTTVGPPPVTTVDALVQTFNRVPGILDLSADSDGSVIQIYGSPSNIKTVVDGVTTNWGPLADFTGIIVSGGDGADYIRAKNISLPMTVYGGAGNDTITTDAGNDYVDGGLGNDAINTQAGDDYAYGADETDTIFGGAGDDTLTGGPGRNELWGEDGNDLLNGSNRPDILYGGNGNDRLRGFAGGDALFGGDGDDHLEGAQGNDALWGQDGDDYIEAAAGNDKLVGGRGNDSLFGQANVDTLYGNLGADLLDGGLEGDTGYYDFSDSLISVEILRLDQ